MKSILLGVTLGIRKSLITFIFLCVLSVGGAQSRCNKHCNLGSPVSDADGNCICKCVLRFTGERCDKLPNCGSKSCVNYQGNLRGDCTCDCVASYTGERCQTFRCPYRDHPVCGPPNYNDCKLPLILGECPYLCSRCSESQRPKLENSEYLYISQYGCIFEGLCPSKEMCKTLGNNGDDRMSCFDESDVDTNCRRCNNGDRHALVNCPVMCALCEKLEVITTTGTPEPNTTTKLSINSSTTRVNNVNLTSPGPTDFAPAVIAGLVVGVVLSLVFISIIVAAVIKSIKNNKRDKEGKSSSEQKESNQSTSNQICAATNSSNTNTDVDSITRKSGNKNQIPQSYQNIDVLENNTYSLASDVTNFNIRIQPNVSTSFENKPDIMYDAVYEPGLKSARRSGKDTNPPPEEHSQTDDVYSHAYTGKVMSVINSTSKRLSNLTRRSKDNNELSHIESTHKRAMPSNKRSSGGTNFTNIDETYSTVQSAATYDPHEYSSTNQYLEDSSGQYDTAGTLTSKQAHNSELYCALYE